MAERYPYSYYPQQGYHHQQQYVYFSSPSLSSSPINSQINPSVEYVGIHDPSTPSVRLFSTGPQYQFHPFPHNNPLFTAQPPSGGSGPSPAYVSPSFLHDQGSYTMSAQSNPLRVTRETLPAPQQGLQMRRTVIERPSKPAAVSPPPPPRHEKELSLVISQEVRPLGKIRRVFDSVTGRPCYPMDPFCLSYIDFLRRLVDEAAKFFHLIIEFASRQGLKIQYEDPEMREKGSKGAHSCHTDASKVLGTLSLDFRWQMKNLCYNRDIYSQEVFRGSISSHELLSVTKKLRGLVDSVAHQQNLADNYRDSKVSPSGAKCGTFRQIESFFVPLLKLADDMKRSLLEEDQILGLQTHYDNLHGIYRSYQEFHRFKQVHFNNMSCCERMDRRGKLEKSKLILQILQERMEEDKGEDWLDLIMTRFASHMNLKLSDV